MIFSFDFFLVLFLIYLVDLQGHIIFFSGSLALEFPFNFSFELLLNILIKFFNVKEYSWGICLCSLDYIFFQLSSSSVLWVLFLSTLTFPSLLSGNMSAWWSCLLFLSHSQLNRCFWFFVGFVFVLFL